MSRLDSISSDFSVAFANCEQAKQAAVLHFACLRAANENGLGGPDIDRALENIHAGKRDSVLSKCMAELSAAFDAKYFDLTDDQGQSPLLPDAIANFLKARTASALAFGLDPAQPPAEALYEAVAASPDRDNLVANLRRML